MQGLKQPSSSSDNGTPEYPRSLERSESGTKTTEVKRTHLLKNQKLSELTLG